MELPLELPCLANFQKRHVPGWQRSVVITHEHIVQFLPKGNGCSWLWWMPQAEFEGCKNRPAQHTQRHATNTMAGTGTVVLRPKPVATANAARAVQGLSFNTLPA